MPTARKTRPPVTGRTFVNVILDESGSMFAAKAAAIEGYNKYLAELRTQKGVKFVLTLTKFNTITTVVHKAVALRSAIDLSDHTYIPGGMTALYDAIGHCVKAMEPSVKKSDRVLNVIITDGEENSSKEFSKTQIEALVKDFEGRGNWTFTYLSAAPKAYDDAKNIGISAGNTMRYTPTMAGTQSAFQNVACSTVAYSAQHVNSTKSFYQPDPDDPLKATKTAAKRTTLGEVVTGLKARRRTLK